jgi:predicted nucleic acid-binding protein
MIAIYIDTDIILDLLLQREPHFSSAAELFRLIETKKVNAYVSTLIIWNIYYIIEKHTNRKKAHQCVSQIRMLLSIIPVNDKIIDLALQSDFKDFEDSIQYYAAKSKNIETIITRNKKDYKTADISVMSASEFLHSL